jgi:quercetin dioxygenase-like cupin family protein
MSAALRPPPLAGFLSALREGFDDAAAAGREVPPMVARMFDALDCRTGELRTSARSEGSAALPVVTHLDDAVTRAARHGGTVARVAALIQTLSPRLTWARRAGSLRGGPAFHDGHANARIVGPGGLEVRRDLAVGVLLMAPALRYVDHQHPPEEVYYVLSAGELHNARTPWHSPGPGGTLHNPPDIRHGLRSGEAPALAVWCLWPDQEVVS